MMLIPRPTSSCTQAARVVALPDPVGPVLSTRPRGCRIQPRSGDSPSPNSSRLGTRVGMDRAATRSPRNVGTTETRSGTGVSPNVRCAIPSCGRPCSSSASPASCFQASTSGSPSASGKRRTSRNRPSTRKRSRTYPTPASQARFEMNIAAAERTQQPRHPAQELSNLAGLPHQRRVIRRLARRSGRRQRLPQRPQLRVEDPHRKIVQRQRGRPPLHVSDQVFLAEPPLFARLHAAQLALAEQPVKRGFAHAEEFCRRLQRKEFLIRRC